MKKTNIKFWAIVTALTVLVSIGMPALADDEAKDAISLSEYERYSDTSEKIAEGDNDDVPASTPTPGEIGETGAPLTNRPPAPSPYEEESVEEDVPPGDAPQTGDYGLTLPVLLMLFSASVFGIGMILKTGMQTKKNKR